MLRIIDDREICDVTTLGDVHRAQLRELGRAYDGRDLSAEARLAAPSDDEDEDEGQSGSFAGSLRHARVVDETGRDAYDAWRIGSDSGAFFRAGSTEMVAMVIQFGLECEDPALRLELGMAMVEARRLPAGDRSYREFAEALATRRGG